MHDLPWHHHHLADLLNCNEHMRWKIQKGCVNACWVYFVESMYKMFLVLSVTFFIFFAVCGVVSVNWPFKFRWSRGYICNSFYHNHQIGSINLLHCCHIFPWLCAWDGFTITCCRFHICLSCFLSLCSLLMCTNDQVHRVNGAIVVLISLHVTLTRYHIYADVFESIVLPKCLSGTFCRVCV